MLGYYAEKIYLNLFNNKIKEMKYFKNNKFINFKIYDLINKNIFFNDFSLDYFFLIFQLFSLAKSNAMH